MASSTLSLARLVEIVKAYRALGTKVRRQYRNGVASTRIRINLLAQDDLYQELCDEDIPAMAISLAVEQRELGRLHFATQEGTVDLLKAALATARQRIASQIATVREAEELAARSSATIGLDVTTATLNDLVAARREATAVFRLQERPADEVIDRAMSTLDLVDDELYLRTWIGFKTALISEAVALTTVESIERSGGQAASHIVEDLAEVRRGIANHLNHYGATTRRG